MIDPAACKVISVVATFAWLWDMVTNRGWIAHCIAIDADEYPTVYRLSSGRKQRWRRELSLLGGSSKSDFPDSSFPRLALQ